jgi:UDP-N-acetylmuramate dehydrogenase
MHANFITNLGGATAADVEALIAEAQREVFDATGIHLVPEVRMLGRRT